jgi:hypothetical protein
MHVRLNDKQLYRVGCAVLLRIVICGVPAVWLEKQEPRTYSFSRDMLFSQQVMSRETPSTEVKTSLYLLCYVGYTHNQYTKIVHQQPHQRARQSGPRVEGPLITKLYSR